MRIFNKKRAYPEIIENGEPLARRGFTEAIES